MPLDCVSLSLAPLSFGTTLIPWKLAEKVTWIRTSPFGVQKPLTRHADDFPTKPTKFECDLGKMRMCLHNYFVFPSPKCALPPLFFQFVVDVRIPAIWVWIWFLGFKSRQEAKKIYSAGSQINLMRTSLSKVPENIKYPLHMFSLPPKFRLDTDWVASEEFICYFWETRESLFWRKHNFCLT
jgi:hypothetical protein